VSDPLIGPTFVVGQSKFLDITIGSLLNDKDAPARDPSLFDQSLRYVRSAGKQVDVPNRATSFCSPTAKAIEMQHIQSVLPDKETLLKIVDYYYEYMLYWAGGFYHGPSFRRKLLEAYGESSVMDLQNLDWRWTALLCMMTFITCRKEGLRCARSTRVPTNPSTTPDTPQTTVHCYDLSSLADPSPVAILASGAIGCPEALSESWGISIDNKVQLARLWGTASVTCLNLGNYTSQYHIYSVQTIYVLHAYEHLAGTTNQWVALRSVAVIIARGLGLHR